MNTASCPNQPSARVRLLAAHFLLPLAGNTLLLSDMHFSFDLNLTSRRSGVSYLPAPNPRSGLSVPPSYKYWSELFQTIRGVRKRARGTCPPPKFPMLKFFSLNSAEFVILNRIFSMFIGFMGASPGPTPSRALTVYGPRWGRTEPLLSPSETNSWLRHCRPCQLLENFGPDLPG